MLLLIFTSSSSFGAEKKSTINGAEVINNNCTRCHNARPSHEFSLAEWSVILPHMRVKANLTGEETQAVLLFYKMLNQKAPAVENSLGDRPVQSGRELMAQYGCQGCHQLGGQGGNLGPPLDNVFAGKGADFIKRKLLNPQFNNPQSAMPKMPLTKKQIQALTTYLSGSE